MYEVFLCIYASVLKIKEIDVIVVVCVSCFLLALVSFLTFFFCFLLYTCTLLSDFLYFGVHFNQLKYAEQMHYLWSGNRVMKLFQLSFLEMRELLEN